MFAWINVYTMWFTKLCVILTNIYFYVNLVLWHCVSWFFLGITEFLQESAKCVDKGYLQSTTYIRDIRPSLVNMSHGIKLLSLKMTFIFNFFFIKMSEEQLQSPTHQSSSKSYLWHKNFGHQCSCLGYDMSFSIPCKGKLKLQNYYCSRELR